MLKQILWDKPKVEVFIDLAGRDLTSGSIINISASEIAKLDKHFIFKIKDGDIINTYTEYHIDNEDGLKIIIDLLDFENSHYVITGNTLTYDSGDGYFMDTDKTLSIENLPADAKATGDAIKAVEDEVDDVKSDLSENLYKLIHIKEGSGSNDFVFIPFSISSSGKYLIKNTSSSQIGVDTTQTNSTSETKTEGSWTINANQKAEIETTLTANYFRVYCNGSNVTFSIQDMNTDFVKVEETLKDLTDLNLENVIPTDTYEDINTTFTPNTYWNSEGTVASVQSYTGRYKASAPIEVAENEVYFIGARAGSSSKQQVICIVDENYNILHKQGDGIDVYYSATITIPQNGKYLLITTLAEDTASVIIRKYGTAKYAESNTEKFKGLSFSVMGDSISSYTGEISSGNTPYYTGNNAGVYSPNEMWYNVVGRILGMTADTINGYSGSLVTSGIRDGITPSSDATRCSDLGTNPNIIIIAMGVNDYSYSAPIGDWDGTINHADDTTTYRTAYATMLKRIKSNYPNALIVCVTPFFTQRGINNGTTYVNSITLTCYDYVKATKDVAEIMGCCVIDGWNIGFNRHNYYPQYCSDSDTTPAHPNARGHRVIGETIAKELSVIAEGYINNINANNS